MVLANGLCLALDRLLVTLTKGIQGELGLSVLVTLDCILDLEVSLRALFTLSYFCNLANLTDRKSVV